MNYPLAVPGDLFLGLSMPMRPPVHRPAQIKGALRHNHSRKENRLSARERGYTTEWDRASKSFLFRYPLCAGCKAIGLICEAVLVDHIRPHNGDMKLFWDERNWQSSCRWHHDSIKKIIENLFSHSKIDARSLNLASQIAQDISKQNLHSKKV